MPDKMSVAKSRRVLFHYPIFNVGGAEMSVLRLMSFLADHDWKIELVLTTGGGSLEAQVDPRVKVSCLRDKGAGDRFIEEKNFFRKFLLIGDLANYIYYRIQEFSRSIPYLFKTYDMAIVSLTGLSPRFCCRWVNAKRRLQWIRNDLSKSDPHGKASRNIEKYNHKIDYYVSVSDTARQSLVKLHPEVKEKAVVLYNVIDAKGMRDRADVAKNPYEGYVDGLKVVTVCRLHDRAKGLFRMVDVHKRLNDEGIQFYWFVVGDGADRERLLSKVREAGLEQCFILLGRQENPFPYYKHADVSATLSYYEGLCGTVNEAKVMGKPVVATRFSGIEEQITDNENGLIVENDEQAIYVGMKRILLDNVLREKLSNDILPRDILDDEHKFEQLEHLLGNG